MSYCKCDPYKTGCHHVSCPHGINMESNFEPTVKGRLKNLHNMIVGLTQEFNETAKDCEYRIPMVEGRGCICRLDKRWTGHDTCDAIQCTLVNEIQP